MSAALDAARHVTLDTLAPGEAAVIVRVDGAVASACRLMELGFTPGTRIEVVRYAPLGDPIELRIRRFHVSLRRAESRHIHVARD